METWVTRHTFRQMIVIVRLSPDSGKHYAQLGVARLGVLGFRLNSSFKYLKAKLS
jgi:hypothetical protein